MAKPFLPHIPHLVVNGAASAVSARVQLPRTDGAVRIAWEGAVGNIAFGDLAIEVSASAGLRLPASTGVEVLSVPPGATHLAYIGPAISIVAGDGV